MRKLDGQRRIICLLLIAIKYVFMGNYLANQVECFLFVCFHFIRHVNKVDLIG